MIWANFYECCWSINYNKEQNFGERLRQRTIRAYNIEAAEWQWEITRGKKHEKGRVKWSHLQIMTYIFFFISEIIMGSSCCCGEKWMARVEVIAFCDYLIPHSLVENNKIWASACMEFINKGSPKYIHIRGFPA